MFPELLQIGRFTVYSYGVLIFLGFWVAIWWPTHLARKERFPSQQAGRAGTRYCSYSGIPTQLSFGVTFTSEVAQRITGVPLHLPLHPTQLYESALVLLSISLSLWLRKRKAFAGEVMLGYALYYAVVRFFLEFFRGDPRGSYLNHLPVDVATHQPAYYFGRCFLTGSFAK